MSTDNENTGSRYINPFTDFGFKRLFGEEANKDLLIDFLNELVLPIHKITELSFRDTDKRPEIRSQRKAVYDIFCKNQNDEEFIVEMQKAFQDFFKDRMIFYSTFPIRTQAKKGKKWNYKLKAVYCIGILDFKFADDDYLFEYDEDIDPAVQEKMEKEYHHDVQLKDKYNRVFYPKLRYKLIEMPKFNKTESELETHFDKWLYFLKHLPDFDEIPAILNEQIFQKAFQVAETANFNEEELNNYYKSLKEYWDLNNVIDSSFAKGEKVGIEKGEKIGELRNQIKTALEMFKEDMDDKLINKFTGLSLHLISEIRKLWQKKPDITVDEVMEKLKHS